MTEFTLIFVALAVIIAMTTLGSVLMAKFVLRSSDKGTRTFTAAGLGPAIVFLPVLGVLPSSGDFAAGLVGMGILLLLLFGIVGYPVSHFATRRLDRLTEFDAEIFE